MTVEDDPSLAKSDDVQVWWKLDRLDPASSVRSACPRPSSRPRLFDRCIVPRRAPCFVGSSSSSSSELTSLSAAPVRSSSQPVLALLPRRFGLLLPPPPPLPFDPRRFPPSATYPLSASAMEPGRCDPPRLARGLTSKRPNRILHRAVRQSVSSWWFLDATASRPAMALDAAPTAAASAALPSPQRLDLRCRSTVAEPLAGIVFPAAAAAASDGWWPVG
mmetsp:Transcript_11064/g.31079  ORF Transcript_11064/g.31079 Transcript_11064/m.31079 type:complete len:219 (+) Transcript_11064:1094-1750(+)